MSYINRYLRNFKPYNVASHKVWQVEPEKRGQILKLDWNEATIPPAPEVEKRIRKLVDNGNFFNLYPATYNTELINLLSGYTGLDYRYLQYFASSDSLEEYISKLFITVGDPVLILWPSYDNFRLTAQVAGAHVMYYTLEIDFTFHAETFEKMIDREEPSLVYICNPNNPTGLELSKEYIEHLLNKYVQTMFLLDEAYWEFSGNTCQELVTRYDNILIARTFSKAFALANIRFGYLIASRENIEFISSIRNPKNITTFAQEAAIGALENIRYMEKYVSDVRIARESFIYSIRSLHTKKIKVFDSKTNFVLLQCDQELTKKELITYLERKNVFVRDTNQSDILVRCIRITIGLKNQMDYVVECIKEYLSKSK